MEPTTQECRLDMFENKYREENENDPWGLGGQVFKRKECYFREFVMYKRRKLFE